MKNKYRDIVSALFVIALAAFIFIFSLNIEKSRFTNLGADFFPKLISAILASLGFLLLGLSVRKLRREDAKGGAPAAEPEAGAGLQEKRGGIFARNADWMSILLIVLYAVGLRYLGFVLSTAVYLFFQMIVLTVKGERRVLAYGLIAVVTPLVIYFLFTRAFHLMLPQGLVG